MEINVGIGEMQVSRQPQAVLVTHALGSCLGVVFHDPAVPVTGLIHVMLPYRSVNEEKAARRPLLFMDAAIPLYLQAMKAEGAQPGRIQVYVAGGSNFSQTGKDIYAIGVRNFTSLCEQLRTLGLPLTRYDVGGRIARTMYADVSTGKVWIQSVGKRWDL